MSKERDIEQFLIDYGASVLGVDRKYPMSDSERYRAFKILRKRGVKRIKELGTQVKPSVKTTFFEAQP